MFIAVSAIAIEPSEVTIYINPGHGGYGSEDRVMTVYPFESGDTATFAESKSNLGKGFRLRELLWEKGYNVVMSRVANTEDDDLGLETIGLLANASGADIFLSIHSNATGTSARRNFPLMLYRGYDNEPAIAGSLEWATYANTHLLTNQATVWTSTNLNVRGDWSFQSSWGTQGYGVLRKLTIPGLLSEGSFHDYIPETYRLLNSDFHWLEGWNFRKAINQYFGISGVEYGAIAGRINDDRVLRGAEANYIMYDDDKLMPIHNATIELYDETGTTKLEERTTDDLYNGIYAFRKVNPGNYKLKFIKDTHYTAEYDVEVKADEVTYLNAKMKKIRSTPPEVVSYSPVWNEGDEGVLCNSPVVLNFNWDMDAELTEAAFSIEPAISGKIRWEDQNYRMIFTPDETYATSTKYTVRLNTTAAHPDGLTLQEPFEFSFTTNDRNYMAITSQFPSEGDQVHYTKPTFELRFDRFPNGTGATGCITILDSKGNKVSLNGRTLKTSNNATDEYGWIKVTASKDLTPGESYTMTISEGLKDYDGITLQKPEVVNFTAVNAGEAKTDATIDAMEDATIYVKNENNCANLASATVSANSDKLFGSKSVNFAYEFTGAEGGEALWTRTVEAEAQDATAFTSNDAVGVHVNGDLTANEVYLELTSETEVKYVKVCDMKFLGWRYVQVPLNSLGEGVPYEFTGVKLAQVNNGMSRTGAFRLDNVNLIVDGSLGVEKVEISDLSVYPNPASEYLIANADGMVDRIDLYSMGGTMVASAIGNVLNVSEVAEGTYIANIYTAKGCAVRKIVVKH